MAGPALSTDTLLGTGVAQHQVGGTVFPSGTTLEIASGATFSIAGTAVTATASELNTSVSGLLATTAEINRTCDVSTRSIAAGATLTLTEAAHGSKTILLDTAAGSVVTLPAPVVGLRIKFIVSVKPTSNFHQIKVAASTDYMAGSVNILDADSNAQTAYQADGTADDNIQLNGTTKGGQIGDWIEIEGVTATQWAIIGQLICAAGSNVADMFSAAV